MFTVSYISIYNIKFEKQFYYFKCVSLRFLQRCPKEFVESTIFIPIMNLAVNVLNIDHRDAHASVTKFLSEFVLLTRNSSVKVGFN